MLPAFLLTVRTPSATTHCAGEPSCADTHSFWLLPSNRTIASEGADPSVPGVTIFGSGLQTSVSSGFGFCWATANATEATKRIRMLSARFRMAQFYYADKGSDDAEKGPQITQISQIRNFPSVKSV